MVFISKLVLFSLFYVRFINSKNSELVKDIPLCGEGFKGLLNYKFGRDDDYLITIASFLTKNTLNLYTGNVIYKKIDLTDCISPLETLNNKCFSIRSENNLPNILCATNTLERNEWMNAIDSSMMCQLTQIKSKLPLIPGEETLEDLEEEDPKGVNLFIHDGPSGRPEIYINGKTTKELEEQREAESLKKTTFNPVEDVNNLFANSTVNVEMDKAAPILTDEEALSEARAEAGLTSQIPTHGYYHYQHI
ncbi:hypothetical protein MACK_002521 [Theileria orientalis]|uniref:PH domain-containing protein n=1 Tax=Theileria orientalis TaxID=68886 RepID=A0A976QXD7_THEOR|nr:hypothetical protein MACK_002521 [Theileria orientalis]